MPPMPRSFPGCASLPITWTERRSKNELLCEEALNLYLEEPPESDIVFPLPDPSLDAIGGGAGPRLSPWLWSGVLIRLIIQRAISVGRRKTCDRVLQCNPVHRSLKLGTLAILVKAKRLLH